MQSESLPLTHLFIHSTMVIEHHSMAATVLVGGDTEMNESYKSPLHKAATMVGRQTRNKKINILVVKVLGCIDFCSIGSSSWWVLGGQQLVQFSNVKSYSGTSPGLRVKS